MERPENPAPRVEPAGLKWAGLYRLSGIFLILTAVIWTIVSRTAGILYASGYPSGAAAYLQLVSQHQALAALTWSLWIVADLLMFAPVIALYIFLEPYNRVLALLGAMLAMFFNVYDISVTELNSLTLVSLASGYAGATSEALRASFVAAATYAYTALPLQTVLSFSTGTLGYLLWCIPIYQSSFRRGTAIYGAVVMVMGLAGSAAPLFPSSVLLNACQYFCIPACALWFVLVGIQLFNHGRKASVRRLAPAAAD